MFLTTETTAKIWMNAEIHVGFSPPTVYCSRFMDGTKRASPSNLTIHIFPSHRMCSLGPFVLHMTKNEAMF